GPLAAGDRVDPANARRSGPAHRHVLARRVGRQDRGCDEEGSRTREPQRPDVAGRARSARIRRRGVEGAAPGRRWRWWWWWWARVRPALVEPRRPQEHLQA